MENMRFKAGDRVRIKNLNWYNKNKNEIGDVECGSQYFIESMIKFCGKILTISHIDDEDDCYIIEDNKFFWTDEMIEGLVEENMGEVSDGYHTFNELYEYRLLYNASFFNELAKQNLYDVHKSKKHSDGEDCFGGGWFIVMAELPTGQVSNHYELKDWDLFQVPEKEKANKWDGHTPQDVAKRMREFLTPKPKYPKTYEECLNVLGYEDIATHCIFHAEADEKLFNTLYDLKVCRDAYWKIAGDEMGLGKPWRPDYDSGINKYGIICMNGVVQESNPTTNWERHLNKVLDFPTEEMRDAFYENFKDLIEQCKELL